LLVASILILRYDATASSNKQQGVGTGKTYRDTILPDKDLTPVIKV